MDQQSNKSRNSMRARVRGDTLKGSHPADKVIRHQRHPYAAVPMAHVLNWLVGTPIASSRALHERLTKVKALAVFSSDALSSVAYATDEILLALVLAGQLALTVSVP